MIRRCCCRWSILLAAAAGAGERRLPSFFAYLQGVRPAMIAYVPSRLRSAAASPPPLGRPTAACRPAALRPAFDGLVLYDFRPEVTPGVLEQAAALGYRAVLLGIWDPRSDAEIAGIAELVRRWGDRLALAVVIGNEGINDNRYDIADLARARDRLRALAGPDGAALPVSTSEPAGDYGWPPLLAFGDFLAPNIHPAIDQAGLAPEAAVAWVHGRAEAIARAAGRPVLVKETGIPNGGGAGFSPERQRAFWAAWLAAGPARCRSTRPVSSSALPPRSRRSTRRGRRSSSRDPMEGHWGLMSVERTSLPRVRCMGGGGLNPMTRLSDPRRSCLAPAADRRRSRRNRCCGTMPLPPAPPAAR